MQLHHNAFRRKSKVQVELLSILVCEQYMFKANACIYSATSLFIFVMKSIRYPSLSTLLLLSNKFYKIFVYQPATTGDDINATNLRLFTI